MTAAPESFLADARSLGLAFDPGDLERLEQAARRVEELIEHCGAYMEEW